MGLHQNSKVKVHVWIRKWQNLLMTKSEQKHDHFVKMLPFATVRNFSSKVDEVKKAPIIKAIKEFL
jgi:hypothetical protein